MNKIKEIFNFIIDVIHEVQAARAKHYIKQSHHGE
jgi:hypothetical protein